jgi:hypothetical protein
MHRFLKKNYRVIITLILCFMAVVSVLNAWWDSAIFDEDAHIPAGYSYVKYHDMRLNPEHPPLIKDLAGLPLFFMSHLKFDITKDFWAKDVNGQWDAGHDLLWKEGNNADKIIFWSRLPMVLLSLIFGLFIFKWVKEIAGTVAGLFALTIYAFDPNILGHNHFVTTDLGIAAFMTFSFYYFLRFIKHPSWKHAIIGGIFLGLVQLAKFSSIMLFPIFGLALILYPLIKKIEPSDWKNKLKTVGEYLGKGIAAFTVSIILVWGVYFINIYNMPKEKLAETIEYYFPYDDPSPKAVLTNKVLLVLNKSEATKPLSEYFLGIAMVFKRVEGGNGAYFMGQVSGKAFPAYFPTVFLIKEPLPNLFFMISALVLSLAAFIKFVSSATRRPLKNVWESIIHYLRVNITSVSLGAFIVLYAYISITGNLNIGFRHLFPILPFVYILTAKVIFDLWRKLHSRQSELIFGIALSALLLFLVSDTVTAYPAYMSYFNQTAGGPKNGYRYVTDSNADWGQDLKRLKSWVNEYNNCSIQPERKVLCKGIPEEITKKENGIKKIHLNYFGGVDIKYYFGDQAIDWWDSRRPLEPGWYAISTNYLMGSIYDKEKKDAESYRWIQNIKPVTQVGTSIFVYYITSDDIVKTQY